jgi:hypothetical protein
MSQRRRRIETSRVGRVAISDNPLPNPPRERGGGWLPPVRGGIEGGRHRTTRAREITRQQPQVAIADHPHPRPLARRVGGEKN